MNVIHWRSNIICAALSAGVLAPLLQLSTWKTRQLLFSACFNWFICCSSEQKCWGHGSPTQRCDAQACGLMVSIPALEQRDSFCLNSALSSSKWSFWGSGRLSLWARTGSSSRAPWEASWAIGAVPGCLFGCAGWSEARAQFLVWMWLRNSSPYIEETGSFKKGNEVQVSALLTRWSMQDLHQTPVTKKKHLQLSPASAEALKCNLAFAWVCTADEQAQCSLVTLFCCPQVRLKFLQSLISFIIYKHPPDFWPMLMWHMCFPFSWQTQKLKLSRKNKYQGQV